MGSRQENRSLGKYIRSTYIFFAVIPMVLACSICMTAVSGYLEQSNLSRLQTSAINLESELSLWIGERAHLLRTCMENEEIVKQMRTRRVLDKEAQNLMNVLLTGYHDELQLHLLSGDGAFRYSTGSIPNLYKLPAYREVEFFCRAREAGEAVRATKYTSYNGRQIALSIGQSLVDDGWDGYAILDIPRKALAALMSEYDSAYISDIVLIDRNNVVAYSQTGRIEEGVTLKDPELLAMLEVPEGEVRGNSGCVRVLEESGLKLLITADNRFIRPLIVGMLAGLAAIVALSLGIAATSGALLSKRISSQMEQLLEVCRKGPSSEFQEKYVPMRGDFQEIVRIGEHLNAMNEQVRELISKIQDKQRILATAELNLLKAQMRPHFIYNVLNDIKAMAKLGKTREIAELVVCFGALMRNTLSVDEEFSTVSEELDLVEKYIQMQNLRGIRPISLRIQVCEALMQQEVPRLILQPLVENAVCHGLPGVEKPIVAISGWIEGEKIFLRVVDNGRGIREAARCKPADGMAYHQGIGLNNISERLRLYYGAQGKLHIASKNEKFTKVVLEMLKKQKSAEY